MNLIRCETPVLLVSLMGISYTRFSLHSWNWTILGSAENGFLSELI